MRRLTALAIAAVLAISGCGGDDESPTTGVSGATGATGPSEPVETSNGIATAGDFMDASIPDQGQAVQELAEEEPGCDGVDTKLGGDFQVGVAIAAASASPDSSLIDLVRAECEEG